MDDRPKKIRLEHIITNFESSLTDGSLQVFYQPVIRSITGDLCGFEALIRWIDKDYGFLSPADFLPTLEAFRLIHKLDLFVAQQVCINLRQNLDNDKDVVPISINLSRLDFEFCDIVSEVDSIVQKYQIPKQLIEIEITEESITKNPQHMTTQIKRFRDCGYEVWMDDFGSGYSSLNILKDIEFDVIKIDMLFLKNFNEKSGRIITSIVDMAKNIGLQTLTEGVETKEHFEFLKSIGCEKIQGYYFGKPLPYDEAIKNIQSKNIQIEHLQYKNYCDEIGKVNLLSVNPNQTSDEYKLDSSKRLNGISWAIIELTDSRINCLNANDTFIKTIKTLGFEDTKSIEDKINFQSNPNAVSFIDFIKRVTNSSSEETFDFVYNGDYCNIRARSITNQFEKHAVLITLTNLSKYTHFKYKMDMDESTIFLLAIFKRIDRFLLDKGIHETVYKNSQYEASENIKEIDKEINFFADSQIYSADKARFLQYYDMTTVEQRIKQSGRYCIEDFFRTKSQDGKYKWCRYILINATTVKRRTIISCQREAPENFDDLLSQYYHGESFAQQIQNDVITNDMLLSNILLTAQSQGIFWKGKDKTFFGCNQMFLDFTGKKYVKDILHKTSEQIGWLQDEQDIQTEDLILNQGHKFFSKSVQCIINGKLKDLILTEYPIYKNSEIVGILGSFINITNGEGVFNKIYRDNITRAFNMKGLMELSKGYKDKYMESGKDFSYIRLTIANLDMYKKQWSQSFTNDILKEIFAVINKATNKTLDIFHIQDNDFIIIKQFTDIKQVNQTADIIKNAVEQIKTVDNCQCTLYADTKTAAFSQVHSCEELLSLVMDD